MMHMHRIGVAIEAPCMLRQTQWTYPYASSADQCPGLRRSLDVSHGTPARCIASHERVRSSSAQTKAMLASFSARNLIVLYFTQLLRYMQRSGHFDM